MKNDSYLYCGSGEIRPDGMLLKPLLADTDWGKVQPLPLFGGSTTMLER